MNDFLDQERCDRCSSELKGRTMSWFNRDTICIECSRWETKIIESRDESKSDLEGIGHIPEVDFEVDWGTDPKKED